jgi:hypothetical protein
MSADAWKAALGATAPSAPTVDAPDVMRVVVDVTVGAKRGLVTASLREGRAFFVDDTGATTGPFVDGARAWLEALVHGGAALASRDIAGEFRGSLPPRMLEGDALREFALTFWRSGIAGAKRGALEDSLRQVRAALSKPCDARWLARFQQALLREDVASLAHLLRGALVRLSATTQPRSDLRLVEVAREHLDAKSPRAIERRYFVDLHEGSFFSEERVQGGTASTGPMPRVLEVGLAEARMEAIPACLAIQQYTLQAGIDEAAGTLLEALALRDFETLMKRVDAALDAHPGFAEPVFLLAPSRWTPSPEKRDQLDVRDTEGAALPWSSEDVSACLALLDVLAERDPTWLVVRAAPQSGEHAFVPLSCGYREGDAWVVRRLRG